MELDKRKALQANGWIVGDAADFLEFPEFKLIVAGGRDFSDEVTLCNEICRLAYNELKDYRVSIVSGMARGADKLAWAFARANNIKVHEFPADWNLGKSAGYRRNVQMADFADGLLAFWDGKSRGTMHMINIATERGLAVRVIRYGEE